MKLQFLGPNLPTKLARKGTIHVHRDGCADIARYPKGADQQGWSADCETVIEAIFEVYDPDEFDYDPTTELAGYEDDLYFAPCVKLPRGVPVR